jgi:prepilin-type N-terminal cleavage/methylation domain-containing protein
MKKSSSMTAPAFTLLEMLIAITVFTIFIGFAISTYLAFHRADQEVLAQRSVMLEIQGTMNLLSQAVKENKIYYEDEESGGRFDILSGARSSLFSGFLSQHEKNSTTLELISPDGQTLYVYAWNGDEETLSLESYDADGNLLTGPELLHNETTRVTAVNFRIFPDEDPYQNATDNDIQYQPTVQLSLSFTVPGRIHEELTVDLQTLVTSRFYQ